MLPDGAFPEDASEDRALVPNRKPVADSTGVFRSASGGQEPGVSHRPLSRRLGPSQRSESSSRAPSRRRRREPHQKRRRPDLSHPLRRVLSPTPESAMRIRKRETAWQTCGRSLPETRSRHAMTPTVLENRPTTRNPRTKSGIDWRIRVPSRRPRRSASRGLPAPRPHRPARSPDHRSISAFLVSLTAVAPCRGVAETGSGRDHLGCVV